MHLVDFVELKMEYERKGIKIRDFDLALKVITELENQVKELGSRPDLVFLQRIAVSLESIAESLDHVKRAEKEKGNRCKSTNEKS